MRSLTTSILSSGKKSTGRIMKRVARPAAGQGRRDNCNLGLRLSVISQLMGDIIRHTF